MATSTVENYLKSILHLEERVEGSSASVGAIAEDLAVTPGTVSVMMRHLSDEKLITYVPRRSIELLPEGRRQALQIVRRHRLIETFLVEIMQLDWSEVHEEAEVLEHVISDRLLLRIDEMLGHPQNDPHGDPIPDADGNYLPHTETIPLADMTAGAFKLVRVDDSNPELLDWLQAHSLVPGNQFMLQKNDPIAGLLQVLPAAAGDIIMIGEKAASQILVEVLPEAET